MGKVTAEFGKNNKFVSSLSSQSKVLNEQIKNQKEKIATLKGALQEASEKYGENDKRMNKVREIPGQMWGIGKNIVSGIWSGISNSIGWITSKVREFARGILDGMKSALGIHSPSTVFEQEVGKNMALGVGEGFVNAMNGVKKDMQEAIVPNFDTNLNMLPSSTNSISNIKTASEVSDSGVLGKLDSILSFLEYYIPGLKSRQICLDTGVLVGELTPPINQELAKIQISKERGR